MSCSSYLKKVFDHNEAKKYINFISKKIKEINNNTKKEDRINAIAFSGNSGAGIAFPVSYKTGLPLICIRKSNEACHGQLIEASPLLGKWDHLNYIIIDDLICSGSTIRRIVTAIKEYFFDATLTSIVLYEEHGRRKEFCVDSMDVLSSVKIINVTNLGDDLNVS